MGIGIDAEKDTLQSLIRSCLLELNQLKYELTELEVERANDNTPQRIKELEQDIVDKEKEVSVIKFKAEDEINLLKKEMEEKDILIKNQEDRIYELDYVNNSLDEIKEYFAEQLRDYKKKELSDVNERLNESYKSIAEKEAQINTLSRTIDEYKIKVIKLENKETGFFYTTTKNTKSENTKGKMKFRKYDPKVRKHVVFTEAKMPH